MPTAQKKKEHKTVLIKNVGIQNTKFLLKMDWFSD